MRIVQICTNATSGSVGSIVRNLCDELQKNGHQYLICFGRGKNPEGYNYFKFDYKLDIYSHVLFARIFDSDGLHSKLATKRLIKKLESYRPDIVHLHCLHGYYINYPLLFKYLKKSHIKVVWTMHDCWAFTGHCCYFDIAKCDKWKIECHKCVQKKTFPKSLILSRSKRNYKKKQKFFTLLDSLIIVTPSKWLLQLLKDSFFKENQCVIINNGIDLNIFKRLNIKKSNTVLGVASVWDQRKGLHDFIDLREKLSNKYEIKIIGAKYDQIDMLNKHGIVAISKTKTIHDLVNEYNKSMVVFNPTYEDNYPTVNLESVACGTPVITYATGGSPEFLINHFYGSVVGYKDIDEIVNIINDISHRKVHIKKPVEFSKELMVNKYLMLFEELVR